MLPPQFVKNIQKIKPFIDTMKVTAATMCIYDSGVFYVLAGKEQLLAESFVNHE